MVTTEDALRSAFKSFYRPPEFIVVGLINHAIFDAHIAFSVRNWRRIKRECNKAARLARKLCRRVEQPGSSPAS